MTASLFTTGHTDASGQAAALQPLTGQSAKHALELLMRKGSVLDTKLTRQEATQILEFMHLEHFAPSTIITFQSQNDQEARLMMILAGEVSVRLRSSASSTATKFSPLDQTSRWAVLTEGATLGLVHAFAGMSSRFMAQTVTELFVASLPRQSLQIMKKQSPVAALRYTEMLMMELALITLDHEKHLHAMNSVARSMQSLIDDESGATRPASL